MTAPAEDLATIRRIMEDAQRTLDDDGKYFVGWGVLAIAGLVATWVVVTRSMALAFMWMTWGVLLAVGCGLIAWWRRRDTHRARARTVTGHLVGDIWNAVCAGIALLVFAGAMPGTVAVSAVPGIVCAVLGIGAYASSSVYRQLPLKAIAIGWWGGAAVMLVRPGVYTIPLMAALVMALLVVPGMLLWRRARAAAG